jgi:hypothetical protein
LILKPVFGQATVEDFLAEGLKKSAATKLMVSHEDQKALVTATSTVLVKHLTFRADGTTSSYHTLQDRRSVEWKKFVIADIKDQAVTQADKLNGITKKYSVEFGCDAHRAWDMKTNRWGEWHAYRYSDFPLSILFQYKTGKWIPEMPGLLKHFAPGAGPLFRNRCQSPHKKPIPCLQVCRKRTEKFCLIFLNGD